MPRNLYCFYTFLDLGLDQVEEVKERMKNEEEVVGVDRVIKMQEKEEPVLALVAQVDHLAVVQVAQAQVEALRQAQIRLDHDQEAKKVINSLRYQI